MYINIYIYIYTFTNDCWLSAILVHTRKKQKNITKASHELPSPSNVRVMILHTWQTRMTLLCLDYVDYVYIIYIYIGWLWWTTHIGKYNRTLSDIVIHNIKYIHSTKYVCMCMYIYIYALIVMISSYAT